MMAMDSWFGLISCGDYHRAIATLLRREDHERIDDDDGFAD